MSGGDLASLDMTWIEKLRAWKKQIDDADEEDKDFMWFVQMDKALTDLFDELKQPRIHSHK